jgi:hypothetical protein
LKPTKVTTIMKIFAKVSLRFLIAHPLLLKVTHFREANSLVLLLSLTTDSHWKDGKLLTYLYYVFHLPGRLSLLIIFFNITSSNAPTFKTCRTLLLRST